MNLSKMKQVFRNSWMRVIAVVLAFSMLLIPVQFPGRADAVAEKEKDTFFKDDFSTDGYLTGVTTKWNEKHFYGENSVRFADGRIYFENSNSAENAHNHSLVYLTKTDGTTEYTKSWSDYSVEISGGFISGKLATQTHMGVMGRVQVDASGVTTFYYAYVKQNSSNVWLYKVTIAADGKQTPVLMSNVTAVKIAPDTEHTLKMAFEGNNIKVLVDGNCYIDVIDESNFSNCGGVGIQLTRQGDAYVDWIKVTHDSITESFVDNFDSAQTDSGLQWNEFHRYSGDTTQIGDGRMNIVVTTGNNVKNYAGSYMSVMDGETDLAKQWTDYSVEMKGRLLSGTDINNNAKLGVVGRMFKDSNNVTTFYYAYFRYNASSVWLYKYTLDATGSAQTPELIDAQAAGITTAPDADYTLKMSFVGNTILVSLNGKQVISVTEQTLTEKITTGFCTQGNAGVLSNYKIAAQVDYVKVELANGTTYVDYFGDASPYQLGVTGKWVVTKNYTSDILDIDNGYMNLGVTTGNNGGSTKNCVYSYLTMSDGTTDYASGWTDYSVEMKMRFTDGQNSKSHCGLLGRVNVDGNGNVNYYYAYIRPDTKMILLYKGINETNKATGNTITLSLLLDSSNLPSLPENTVVDSDYTLKMTFDGNNIQVFVDDVQYIDIEDNTYSAGSVGVQYNRIGAASVDYVKVFPLGADAGESFAEYTFEGATALSDLSKKWTFAPSASGTFSVADDQLGYTDAAAATGIAALKPKALTVLADSAVIADGSAGTDGGFAVLGRYDAAANNYYKLAMDINDGLKLIRCVAGAETVIASFTRSELWENHNIMLNPGETYQLKLQMYGARVEAFIGDLCLYYWDDPEWTSEGVLAAGVGAVEMQSGAKLNMLEVAEVQTAASLELMFDTNFNGKDSNLKNNLVPFDDVIEVPVGYVPDVKHLYLKVTAHDESVTIIPVDAAQISAYNVSAVSDVQTATITYDRQSVQLKYKVIDRSAAVAQLNADLTALDVSTLTLDDKAAVYALSDRYDAFTAAEREGISAENKAKLAKAEETIEFLLYPMLAGSKIVFEDTFDSAVSEEAYTTERTVTHTSYKGNWYVENGTMTQYFVDDTARTTSIQCANVLKDKNWKIKSVSVDFQVIDRDVWGGMIIPFGTDDYYRFIISDKVSATSYKSRVYLYKNTVCLDNYHVPKIEDRFQPGVWYNLKLVFDGDMIRCYVDDQLILESKDNIYPEADAFMSSGTVGFYSTEGAGRFDNLVIRGEVAEGALLPDTAIRDAQDYTDDFNDETAGKDPSHWLEEKVGDNWLNDWTVQDVSGNMVYATNNTASATHSWLHVFETDVDYSAMVKVNTKGNYPIVGLTARVNYADSYIKAGYDYELQKWFIKVRYGTDFQEVAVYSNVDANVDFSDWKQLRLKAVGSDIELYYNGGETPVIIADAMQKVMPGRVGVYTERCQAMIDDVDFKLLSEQGHVNEGVLEFYTAAQYCSILVLPTFDGAEGPNDDYLLFSYGSREVSSDGGKTFKVTDAYGTQSLGTATRLHNGHYIAVTGGLAFYSEDCKTWTEVGQMPYGDLKYTQTGDRVTEIKICENQYRIFFTSDRHIDAKEAYATRSTVSDVFYSDDLGATWTKSSNSAVEMTNQATFGETNIIQAADGKLLQYCSYNKSQEMRYMISNDNGVTWEGDYAIPYLLDGGQVSFCVKEDPYAETRTYYMATVYNKTQTNHQGMPRLRMVLLRSYAGYNWEFLADVDRWGEHSEGPWTDIMQNINMYLAITPEAVYPMFCRAEEWSNTEAHNIRYGRAYRFDKVNLKAYDEWPLQYVLSDTEITHIEGIAGDIPLNSELSDLLFNVYYYRADGDIMDQITMDQAFVNGLDTSKLGEQTVTLDYKHFRAVFNVNVVMGDAPVISGAAEDKTYCIEQEVTVSDANGDLESVTLDGVAVTLVDGKFTVTGKEGQQTIVATDKAGNVTTLKITVNAAHTGGEATCCDKAKCGVCGESYGEKNADKHTKEAKWTITADKHSKAYECCGKVVVEEAAHTGGEATCEHKAKCEVCNAEYGKLADHTGGTATCTDKAKCDVCGEAYGEKNADKHTKEAKWTITGDKHSKAYECCGKVVVAEEAHEWSSGKCEECGYEAAPGTEQKPIEIPADKETVKEEAKMEAGEEQHYELDEKMAGMTITIKGEGAYAIIEGKKYEAVNGVLEVKLPAKTGKIPVIIGNAGTKAGTFSITIATPSQDNSDTGDNTAIVLFGSLMALSVLAAGVLLVPNIRKKLMR